MNTTRVCSGYNSESAGCRALRAPTVWNRPSTSCRVRAAVNFGTRVATIDTSEAVDAAALCQAVRRAGYQADLCTDDGRSASDPDADHARQLLIRLAIAAVLFVPVADLSVMFGVVPATRFTGWQWVLSALALPVVTWAAWPFHRVAMRNARHHAASMETLISVGITAATIWSLYTVFGNHSPIERSGIWQALLGSHAIYFEVAAGVTVFVLVGRYFEARAKSQAGSALRALAALSAKEVAVLLPDGSEMVIPADELKEQQRFVVRPGQIVAADGLAVDGSAAVDMSAMTGEAKPTRVRPGGQVIGGTTVLDGRLIVEAAAVGADTQFAGMVRLVEQAQAQKADAQRLADRISSVFVPAVLVIAALTAAGWLIAGGQPDRAVSAALAVLVIACPCALGLGVPTAMMVASGRGAQLGIFLKGYKSLQATRAATPRLRQDRHPDDGPAAGQRGDRGTGLGGRPGARLGRDRGSRVRALGGARDRRGNDSARRGHRLSRHPCRGVTGTVSGRAVRVGKPSWIGSSSCHPNMRAARRHAESLGETAVFVEVDGEPCGVIAVADAVRPARDAGRPGRSWSAHDAVDR